MSGTLTSRLTALEAAADSAAAARTIATNRKRKLVAVHMARAASRSAAERDRIAATERYARAKLARAAAAGDIAAATELEPLLRARTQLSSTLAARRAGTLLRDIVAPVLGKRETVRLVELCCGYGGGLIATELAHPDVESVHAGDCDAGKVALARAVFSASLVPRAAPVRMDVMRDYTDALVTSWGAVTLLVSSIPCIYHSPDGARGGMAALRPFLTGLFSVIGRARARVLLLECVTQLEDDPLFDVDVLAKLHAMGYYVSCFCLDASGWSDVARLRLYVAAFHDSADWNRFLPPSPPRQRTTKLTDILLKPYTRGGPKEAPRWVYDFARRETSGRTSKAAAAVSGQPLLRSAARSAVVTVNRVGAVHQLSDSLTTAPTLKKSTSGAHRMRDSTGSRTLCGREEGMLHGVPPRYTDAMVCATLARNKTDNAVVSAIGDGFSIHVVQDVVRTLLRACCFGV